MRNIFQQPYVVNGICVVSPGSFYSYTGLSECKRIIRPKHPALTSISVRVTGIPRLGDQQIKNHIAYEIKDYLSGWKSGEGLFKSVAVRHTYSKEAKSHRPWSSLHSLVKNNCRQKQPINLAEQRKFAYLNKVNGPRLKDRTVLAEREIGHMFRFPTSQPTADRETSESTKCRMYSLPSWSIPRQLMMIAYQINYRAVLLGH